MMETKRINCLNALKNGDLFTKLSALLLGAGMIGHGQIVKGILVLAIEVAFILYMMGTGLGNLAVRSGMRQNRFMNMLPAIIPSVSC